MRKRLSCWAPISLGLIWILCGIDSPSYAQDPLSDGSGSQAVFQGKRGGGFRGEFLDELMKASEAPGGGDLPAFCSGCTKGSVACAGDARGTLSAASCRLSDGSYLEAWSLELSERGRVEVALESADFPPYLFLTDGNCLVLDDSGACDPVASGRSCLSLTLPAGNYYLAANSLDGGMIGAYQLSVSCSAPGGAFRRGDADGSGKADITDAVVILGFLFRGDTTMSCLDAADTNDTGRIDITDGIYLLAFLFQGGPDPSAPGPFTCGSDTTPSASITAPCVYTKCP